ncbi:hypothetical protein RCL1_001457 [Eukaryota sp. TZLM3-RCL]
MLFSHPESRNLTPSNLQVFFDFDAVTKNSHVFQELGRSCLIVTGHSSAVKSGALDDVLKSLPSDCSSLIFSEIEENPRYDTIFKAFQEAKNATSPIEFIVAIGGGSPLDAGKAIAVLLSNFNLDSDKEQVRELIFTNKYPCSIPVVCITTTCGTGSEVTTYSIITDTVFGNKRNLVSQVLPTVSFLDPKYLQTLPRRVLISTALDALSHLLEARLTVKGRADTAVHDLARIGLSFWANLWDGLSDTTTNEYPNTLLISLLEMQYVGGIAINRAGTTLVHALGYLPTFYYGLAHGISNTLFMVDFLSIYSTHDEVLIREILKLLGVSSLKDLQNKFDSLLSLCGFTLPKLPRSDLGIWVDKVWEQKGKLATYPFALSIDEIGPLFRSIVE